MQKTFIYAAFIFFSIAAYAQTGDTLFNSYYKGFREKLINNNIEGMSELIKFPISGFDKEAVITAGDEKFPNDKGGFLAGGYKALFTTENIEIFKKLVKPLNKGFIIKFDKKPFEISCGFSNLKDYLELNGEEETELAGLEGYMLENALYYSKEGLGYSYIFFFAKIDGAYKLVKYYRQ